MVGRTPMAAPCDLLSTILHSALTQPSLLDSDAPVAVGAALSEGVADELALSAAAAVLYGRPALVPPTLVDRLYAYAKGTPLTAAQRDALHRLLGYLAVTDHAHLGW